MDPEEPKECCCEDGSCGLHLGHIEEEFPQGLSLAETVRWAIEHDSAVPVDWKEQKWCGGGLECFYAGVVPRGWQPEEWVGYFIENILFKTDKYGSSKPDATILRTSDALIVVVIPKEKEAAVFQYDAMDTLKKKRRRISLRRLNEERVSKIRGKRDSLYGLNWTRVDAQLSAISELVREMMERNEKTVKDLMTSDGESPSIVDVLREQAMDVLLNPEVANAQADAQES